MIWFSFFNTFVPSNKFFAKAIYHYDRLLLFYHKKTEVVTLNDENLIKPNNLTPRERRESASKAGKASGAARRKKRDMKACMNMLLELQLTSQDDYKILAKARIDIFNIDEKELTNILVVNASLLNEAKKGNVNAVKELRSIIQDDAYAKHKIKYDNELLKLKKAKVAPKSDNKIYNGIPASLVAPSFAKILFDIADCRYSEFVFLGGRGSTKSSFISLNIIDLLMKNNNIHACVLRQVANTLRSSVYQQILWAISVLGLDDEFNCTVSPLEITRVKTGQKIYFRGADDPNKIKSIKVPFGYIEVVWFEELDQFSGEESVRKIEQSVIRGGDVAYKFKSFNLPKSAMNWANKYIKTPREDRAVILKAHI